MGSVIRLQNEDTFFGSRLCCCRQLIHTPLVKWPLDGLMVVSSQESTMVMVSYQDMEQLATEQSTLAIMDSIILASVRPRLNHTPLARFTLDFPFTMLPLMVVFTTQVR